MRVLLQGAWGAAPGMPAVSNSPSDWPGSMTSSSSRTVVPSQRVLDARTMDVLYGPTTSSVELDLASDRVIPGSSVGTCGLDSAWSSVVLGMTWNCGESDGVHARTALGLHHQQRAAAAMPAASAGLLQVPCSPPASAAPHLKQVGQCLLVGGEGVERRGELLEEEVERRVGGGQHDLRAL